MNLKATSPLAEWLSYLENITFKAIVFGAMERIKSVAEELDLLNPTSYVITVGGTNGKGTTCRLLETILLNHGLRVGVYSSPIYYVITNVFVFKIKTCRMKCIPLLLISSKSIKRSLSLI